MNDFVIDADGKVWPATAAGFLDWAPLRGSEGDRFDRLMHLVGERGFVYLRQEPRLLIVVFRGAPLRPETIGGLFRAIAVLRPDRIVLSFGSGERCVEAFTEIDPALRRIEELAADLSEEPRRPGLWATRQTLDAIENGTICELLRVWHQTDGNWTAEARWNLEEADLLADAVIVANPLGSERLVIRHWGSRRWLLGRKWASNACGREVEDQPQKAFGRWAAATYREALRDGQPQLHRVEAALLSGRRLRRRNYDRLLLPLRPSDGERIAVCVNLDRMPIASGRML